MDNLITIILFLFVFCMIVVSHEFGHYIVAKLNGVRVIEFTIGMGPKLVGFHKNGTDYCIRLLPFGGACIYDMADDEEVIERSPSIAQKAMAKAEERDESIDESRPGGFSGASARLERIREEKINKRNPEGDKAGSDAGFLEERQGMAYSDAPVFVKMAIVIAGPLFNFILAYLMALVVVWFSGSTVPEITGVMDGYPAKEAGIMPGDVITKMNGSKVYLASEIYVNTYLNQERDMTIEYLRDGQKYVVTVTPKYSEESGRYLVGFNGYGRYVTCQDSSIFGYAYYEVRYAFVGTAKSILMLLQGRGSKDDLAGPVGMAQAIDEVKDAASPYGPWVVMLNMFNIIMILSVNLGIMNLLPLPAIDGGKLLFILVELVRGKPVPPEKEGIVHLVGFALLMILMVFVMYNDIMRLIAR